MKRGLYLLAFLAILFSAAYGQQAVEVKGKAEVMVEDPNVWDFGKVNPGEVLKHDFILSNHSQKTLNVKEVNTSCGCTVPDLKKKSLMPGESTPLEVKFNSKGYSGPITQYIYVHTDSLDNPVIRFIIKADIAK